MFSRVLIIALVVTCMATVAHADKRVALVIGNSDYSSVERLRNPENDARKLAETLKNIGFDKVTLKLNLNQAQFRQTLGAFSRDAASADTAVIYFAGHGIEVGGENYLIPTDASLDHVDDVEFQTLPLQSMMYAVNRAKAFKLVILDACRNNPFRASMTAVGASRSVGRGLARVSPTGGDTMVAYAAKEGTVAADGDGEHSPFAEALIEHIAKPGLDVRIMFGLVRDSVIAATGGAQEPFTYQSLGGSEIYLHASPAPQTAEIPTGPSNEPAQPQNTAAAAAWAAIKDTKNTAFLDAFVSRFPNSVFAEFARIRRSELQKLAKLNDETPVSPKPTPERATTSRAKPGLADIVSRVSPSVVTVSATFGSLGQVGSAPNSPFKEFFDKFFDKDNGAQKTKTLNASGYILNTDGYIVTASFAVDQADIIEVRLRDGSKLPASLVGVDRATQVAVIKIAPRKDLRAASYGDSKGLRLGQNVFTIGHSAGFDGTLTRGLVTGLNRNLGAGAYDSYIETDAQIAKSQGGAPLFDSEGSIVGMVASFIQPKSGGALKSYAIPGGLVQSVTRGIIEFGETRRGWLGVRIQAVTDEIAEGLALDKPARGALVNEVTKGGPAAIGGVEATDVILSVNGVDVIKMRDLPRMIADKRPGSEVRLKLFRKGKTIQRTVRLGVLPKSSQNAGNSTEPQSLTLAGMTLEALSEELRKQYKISSETRGLVITKVAADSIAAGKALKVGGIIEEIGQQPVSSVSTAAALVRAQLAKQNNTFLFFARAAGGKGTRFVSLRVVPDQFKVTMVPRADTLIAEAIAQYNASKYPEALRTFERAAETGSADAMWRLGVMYGYPRKTGLKQDGQLALKWITAAAQKGHAEAQDRLGFLYFFGKAQEIPNIKSDYPRAQQWYRRAAEQGHLEATRSLASMYQQGTRIKKDNAEALKWYRRAAEKEHPGSLYGLAEMYDQGAGVAQSSETSAQYLFRAFKTGMKGVLDHYAKRSKSFSRATMRAFQRKLRSAGHYKGAIDGKFGPGTERAIHALAKG